jgi:hypothetical protein
LLTRGQLMAREMLSRPRCNRMRGGVGRYGHVLD